MSGTLATFRTGITNRLVTVPVALTAEMRDTAIAAALEEFSKARPRVLAALFPGTGGFSYALEGAGNVLAGFLEGFSSILEVLYPYDATVQQPDPLDSPADYGVFRIATGPATSSLSLRFLTATPAAAESIHVTYTVPHTVDDASCSVATADHEALGDLATAYACEALASFFTQSVEPTLQADTVERRSQGDQYRSQAEKWRKAYRLKMGGESASGPASALGQLESAFPERDHYFFHGRR